MVSLPKKTNMSTQLDNLLGQLNYYGKQNSVFLIQLV